MSGSSMSDELDSLDASEKAAVEDALNNAKRPSDDVVQSQAFAFADRRISICRAARTPEQEKAVCTTRLSGAPVNWPR